MNQIHQTHKESVRLLSKIYELVTKGKVMRRTYKTVVKEKKYTGGWYTDILSRIYTRTCCSWRNKMGLNVLPFYTVANSGLSPTQITNLLHLGKQYHFGIAECTNEALSINI